MKENSTHEAYRTRKYAKLALAIALDLIGMTTFLIPGLGEVGDLVWAPMASLAGFIMFGGFTGAAGAAVTFTEELLPGTDWIPSLTLTWLMKYVVLDQRTFASFARRRGEPSLPQPK